MEKICLCCGENILSTRKNVKYCSSKCSTKRWRILNPDRHNENSRRQKSGYLRKESPEVADKRRKKQAMYGHTPKGRFNNYKSSAKIRSIPFSLTYDEFMTFWRKPCEYCGDEILKIGVDRVESNQGYILGNCVSCCETCNRMKLDYTTDYFLSKCKQIVEFTSKHNKYRVGEIPTP